MEVAEEGLTEVLPESLAEGEAKQRVALAVIDEVLPKIVNGTLRSEKEVPSCLILSSESLQRLIYCYQSRCRLSWPHHLRVCTLGW